MVQVVSAWMLCKSYVTSLVIGSTKIFQLEELSKDVISDIINSLAYNPSKYLISSSLFFTFTDLHKSSN